MFAVGRKCQTVGLRKVFGQQSHVALVVAINTALNVETIDALERNLLLLTLHQIQRGVGEVERAIRANNDVIRAIEFLSLKTVGEHSVFSIRRQGNNRAKHAGALDEAVIVIVGAPIGVAERNKFFLPAVQEDPVNLVLLFIADIEETGVVPHGTLGKTKIAGNFRELAFAIHQLPKLRRLSFELKDGRGRLNSESGKTGRGR